MYVEKFLLAVLAIGVGTVLFANPLKFDGVQRATLAGAPALLALFLVHTVYIKPKQIGSASPSQAEPAGVPPAAGQPEKKCPAAIRVEGSTNVRIEGNVVEGMELLDVSNSQNVSAIDNVVVKGGAPEDKARAFELWVQKMEKSAGDPTQLRQWLEEVRKSKETEWAKLPAERREREVRAYEEWAKQLTSVGASRERTLAWLEEVRRDFYRRYKLPPPSPKQ